MRVELLVKILAVALAQRHAHAEKHNAANFRAHAAVQQRPQVFFAVVEKRINGDSHTTVGMPQSRKASSAAARSRVVLLTFGSRIRHSASSAVVSVICTTHLAFRLMLWNKSASRSTRGGFCNQRKPEAVPVGNFQAAAGEPLLLLERHIRVGHRAGAYHAAPTFSFQRVLKERGRVDFHLDVLERVVHAVTAAARIAVNAAVRAASVKVHAVLGREQAPDFLKMHVFAPVSFRDRQAREPRKFPLALGDEFFFFRKAPVKRGGRLFVHMVRRAFKKAPADARKRFGV